MAYTLDDPRAFLPYGTGTTTTPTGQTVPGGVNTLDIGAKIGQYHTGALSDDPRMPQINRNLAGVLDPAIARNLAQASAERGVGIGSYGGGNDLTAYLRALGLTQADLQNQGVAQYGQAVTTLPQLSPATLFVSPYQSAAMNLERELSQNQLANQLTIARERNAIDLSGLAVGERQAAAGRDQAAYQFGVNRADAQAYSAANKQAIDAIIARNSGGAGGATSTGSSSGIWYGTAATPSAAPTGDIWAGMNSQPAWRSTPVAPQSYYGAGDDFTFDPNYDYSDYFSD